MSRKKVSLSERVATSLSDIDRIDPRENLPGEKYRIRVIRAGEGSSGIYPIEMLERDAAAAWPKGTQMRANHDSLCEGDDIRRLMAKTITDPWTEGDEVFTDIYVSEQWVPFMHEFADVIGVSISAGAELEDVDEDADDYDPDAKRVVKRILSKEESPYNAIDFVSQPGAEGRVLQAISEARKVVYPNMNVREQARFAADLDLKTPKATPPTDNQEGSSMDPEEIKTIAQEAATTAVAAVLETIKPAPADPEDKPSMGDVAEAVVAAGLTEGSRKAVYQRIERGEAVEAAIAAEKSREDEIEKAIAERAAASPVREHEGFVVGAGTPFFVADESDPTQTEQVRGEFDSLLEASLPKVKG